MFKSNLRNVFYFNNVRRRCSSVKGHKFKGLSEKPNPHLIKHDYIGPPDKESNLRPYVRAIPKNESNLARKFRLRQIEVEEWNQKFWSRHNKRFYEEKQEFIKLHNQSGVDVSADKLSEFYKSFLDKNHKVHMLYNISWYIKNYGLLILAFQVAVEKFFKRLKTLIKKRNNDKLSKS